MRILLDNEAISNSELSEIMPKPETFELAAIKCLEGEGIDSGNIEISLSFVAKEEIRELNREYRNVDKPTDVLSFPLIEDINDLEEYDEEEEAEEILLGDVVICPQKAWEQAAEYGHSVEREIIYLFVHSVLHLLGYDHIEEEDKTEMRRREEKIMTLLRLERR